jgi:hypothetical protein
MHIRAGAKGSVGFVIFKEKLLLETLDLQTSRVSEAKSLPRMTAPGQTEKNSVRANVIPSSPESGHAGRDAPGRSSFQIQHYANPTYRSCSVRLSLTALPKPSAAIASAISAAFFSLV